MKNNSRIFLGAFLILLAFAATFCARPQDQVQEAPPSQSTYSDPFAYCTAVGTIDAPDARYTGEAMPETIINGFKSAAGLQESTMPLEQFQKSTFWRCMGGQVYACNVGANLPCQSKANTNKTATAEMGDFCKANPDSDFIPMAVTGHDTIYSWHCVKDAPEVQEQISEVDASGFLANIWYPLQQP